MEWNWIWIALIALFAVFCFGPMLMMMRGKRKPGSRRNGPRIGSDQDPRN